MAEQVFPVVKGPAKAFYLLDSHHTAFALVHETASAERHSMRMAGQTRPPPTG